MGLEIKHLHRTFADPDREARPVRRRARVTHRAFGFVAGPEGEDMIGLQPPRQLEDAGIGPRTDTPVPASKVFAAKAGFGYPRRGGRCRDTGEIMLPAGGRDVYGSPMRAALHLLLMACVVWCALGLSEPAEAYAPGDRQHAAASAAPVDPAPDGDAADARGSVDHHHCPIAPDLPTGYLAERIDPAGSAPFRSPAIPLVSLTRAPPLQPPAAA